MSNVDWQEMASAPKDGTMLRLLVNPDQEEFTAFDDSLTPFETIGFNNLADTGEDRWEFAGWDWQQDCFITGRGEVVGWSEMSPKPDGSAATSEYKPVVCVGRPTIDKLTSGEHVETEKVILIPASDLSPPPQPKDRFLESFEKAIAECKLMAQQSNTTERDNYFYRGVAAAVDTLEIFLMREKDRTTAPVPHERCNNVASPTEAHAEGGQGYFQITPASSPSGLLSQEPEPSRAEYAETATTATGQHVEKRKSPPRRRAVEDKRYSIRVEHPDADFVPAGHAPKTENQKPGDGS